MYLAYHRHLGFHLGFHGMIGACACSGYQTLLQKRGPGYDADMFINVLPVV